MIAPAVPPIGGGRRVVDDASGRSHCFPDSMLAVEEEQFTRQKHAPETFPELAIQTRLDHRDLELGEVDRVILPYDPSLCKRVLEDFVPETDRASVPNRVVVGRTTAGTNSGGRSRTNGSGRSAALDGWRQRSRLRRRRLGY